MFVHILIRILLILVFGISAFYVATQTYFWLVSIWLIAGMLLTINSLVRYLANTRRQLADFLLAVSQDDFTSTSYNSGDSLDFAYSMLNEKLMKLRGNRAVNEQFLGALIEHVGVALVGFESDTEKITVLNGTAKELFGKSLIITIENLKKVDAQLPDSLRQIKSGQNRLLKMFSSDGRVIHLSIIARELILQDRPYKLVSLQNIQSELEAREAESWHKLIRVLTHEIKNSAIPIATLSEVVNGFIIDEHDNFRDLATLDHAEKEDLRLGLETIGRRSGALVKFVNAYSQLARLPEPEIGKVDMDVLINGVLRLFNEDFDRLRLDVDLEDCMMVAVDRGQMEQAVINLLKNALEALERQKDPEIAIRAFTRDGRSIVEISDNGPGMSNEMLEQVFVPFYTTKSNGSGIGLSLTQQIVRAHKGELRVSSIVGQGSTFTIIL